MNLEVLNRYVLGMISLFAICLYIAMVVTGFAELMSPLPQAGSRHKRSRNVSASRRWRKAKRSPHS